MNEIFKEIVNQITKIWNSLTVAQRVLVSSVTLVTIIGLIVIISIPSGVEKKDHLVFLYKNLSSEDLTAVIEKLDQNVILIRFMILQTFTFFQPIIVFGTPIDL